MGGHNDQNGNSNGQHDDVSSTQIKSEKFYGCTPCVFVCICIVDTRVSLTAILKFFMCVSGVEVRLEFVKN